MTLSNARSRAKAQRGRADDGKVVGEVLEVVASKVRVTRWVTLISSELEISGNKNKEVLAGEDMVAQRERVGLSNKRNRSKVAVEVRGKVPSAHVCSAQECRWSMLCGPGNVGLRESR